MVCVIFTCFLTPIQNVDSKFLKNGQMKHLMIAPLLGESLSESASQCQDWW